MPFFIDASPLTWIRHIFVLRIMHRIGSLGMSSSKTELLSTFGKIINKFKLERKIDDYWLFFVFYRVPYCRQGLGVLMEQRTQPFDNENILKLE